MLARLCVMRAPCSKGHQWKRASSVWYVAVVANFFFFAAFMAAFSARLVPTQQVSEWQNSVQTIVKAAGLDPKHCFVIKPLVYLSWGPTKSVS